MDDLERLRNLLGDEADDWTTVQLEQLRRDVDAMAGLLLDFYRSRRTGRDFQSSASPEFDVPDLDR